MEKKICKCGRQIVRKENQEKGICNICSPIERISKFERSHLITSPYEPWEYKIL